MNRKTIVILILIILVALGINSWNKKTFVKNNAHSLKVGVLLPLRGDLASLGEVFRQGIELAISDSSASSSVNIVYEDDKFSPQGAVSGVNKLIFQDKVDVILTAFATEGQQIVQIVDKEKIPLLIICDSPAFVKTSGEYVFGNGFSNEKNAAKMANFAYDKLHLKKVAVIPELSPYSNILGSSFKSEFERLGGSIMSTEQVSIGQNDFRTVIYHSSKTA